MFQEKNSYKIVNSIFLYKTYEELGKLGDEKKIQQ